MNGAPVRGPRSVAIVIPAFNEETRLPGTVRTIAGYLRANGWDAEIIVVNDGSTDGTAREADALASSSGVVRAIHFPTNHGKGFAVREGVRAAVKPAILLCDADLATPIEELERLWEKLEEGWDVVIGSRALPTSRVRAAQPLHRRGMGRFLNGLLRLTGLRGIRDTQCGFKLFRASAGRRLFEALRSTGFGFDVEILLRARREGLRVAEVGVEWHDCPGSHIRPLRDSLTTLVELARLRDLR